MKRLLGIQEDSTPHREKFISGIGGFLGIYLILQITSIFLSDISGVLIVASMGASAVLLFAVPHGPLSQPWPLVGGHVISALIGVSMYKLVPDITTAAAMAVGISIGVMYYSRCIHPPGGATALVAVVGGDQVNQLGYQFVITPVLVNALIIMLVAVLVNYAFSWRRYPAILSVKPDFNKDARCKYKDSDILPKKDIEYALKSMQTFSDITEDELMIIFQKASQHNRATHLKADDIKLGHYYMHGNSPGSAIVRRVIDESEDSSKDLIIYKVITGPDRGRTETSSREVFANWAKHEVVFDDEQWKITGLKTD